MRSLILFCIFTSSVMAEDNEITISGEVEKVSGNVIYQIGGKAENENSGEGIYHWPLSRLKFPTSTFYGVLKSEIPINKKVFFRISFKKNIDDPDQKSEDFDFFTEDHLDVYSSSTTLLDAWIIDLELATPIYLTDKTKIYVSLGIEHAEHDILNVDGYQISFDPNYSTGALDSPDARYESKEDQYYIGINFKKTLIKKLRAESEIHLSPLISSFKRDTHYLRDIQLTDNSIGYGGSLNLNLVYSVTKSIDFYVGLGWRKSYSEGKFHRVELVEQEDESDGTIQSRHEWEGIQYRAGLRGKF